MRPNFAENFFATYECAFSIQQEWDSGDIQQANYFFQWLGGFRVRYSVARMLLALSIGRTPESLYRYCGFDHFPEHLPENGYRTLGHGQYKSYWWPVWGHTLIGLGSSGDAWVITEDVLSLLPPVMTEAMLRTGQAHACRCEPDGTGE